MTDSSDKLERLIAEYLEALESGDTPDRDSIVAANPDVADDLNSFFANPILELETLHSLGL